MEDLKVNGLKVPSEKEIIIAVAITYADMAELADAPDLGSGVPDVKVQVLLPAPADSVGTQNRVATAKIRTLSHDGGVRIYLY